MYIVLTILFGILWIALWALAGYYAIQYIMLRRAWRQMEAERMEEYKREYVYDPKTN